MIEEVAPPQSLADIVITRRTELGITKAELARRAKITRSTIHEIENGTRRTIQTATSQALDRALELPPGSLRRLTTESIVLEAKSRSVFISSASENRSLEVALLELLAQVIARLDSQTSEIAALRDELRAS